MSGPAGNSAPDASAPALDAIVHLTYRDGSGSFHRDWPTAQVDQAVQDKAGLLWVDIQGQEEHSDRLLDDWLCRTFQFHPLAIEDALKESHIPKVDDWSDYLYIVFHVARIDPDSDDLRPRRA